MDNSNSLVEILKNTTSILPKVYEDLAQPGVKQVGMALGTTLGLVNTILLPLKLVNEIAKENFEKNINKYRENLKEIPEDKINDVPPQLALPIFDWFTYITDDDISDLFVNLLTTASNKDTINEAHPSFVQLIDRMSPDEAKIISFLKYQYHIPYIKFRFKQKNKDSYTEGTSYLTLLVKTVDLELPDNVPLYMDNLTSMGILINNTMGRISDTDIYHELKNYYSNTENKLRKQIEENKWSDELTTAEHLFEITFFGKSFINSCTKNIKK